MSQGQPGDVEHAFPCDTTRRQWNAHTALNSIKYLERFDLSDW